MAGLGRFEDTVQDADGNAVPGLSVEIRKQGAQILGNQSGPANTFNVDSPGSFVGGDIARVGLTGTTRAIVSVTATTITVGGPGFGNLTDNQRICNLTLPTIYEDEIGNSIAPNPLITDINGYVSAYIPAGYYDIVISGSGITSRLIQDVVVGGQSMLSNVYNSSSGVAFKLDTLRALGAADKIVQASSQGVEAFSVGGTGNTAIAGTLTVTGATTLTGGLAGFTNTGVFTNNADGLSIDLQRSAVSNLQISTSGSQPQIKTTTGRLELSSGVASGGALLGAIILNSSNNLVGAGDNLLMLYNAGVNKLIVDKDGTIAPKALGPVLTAGNGVPGALSLPKGSIYMRTDGGVGTTVYVTQGGGTWNAIAGV